MEHDNDIIIGEDFEPMLVAHALTSAYVEVRNSELTKAFMGTDTRLERRFSLEELEAIAKHILSYVDMKRKEERNKEE